MNKSILLISVVLSILLSGCYDVKQDNKGRTVKVNKITGELHAIEGDKIIKLKNEQDIKAEQDALIRLDEPKAWPIASISISDNPKVKLITKWAQGEMYYQFFVDKNLRPKGYHFASLNIMLYDFDDFLIKQFPITVASMTGLVGPDNLIEAMEYKGKITMDQHAYKKIARWSLTWSGFHGQ